jgi:hypothetical protein
MRAGGLAAVAILVAACGASQGPAGAVRFRNASPVWLVNDRKPVAKAPRRRDFNRLLYNTDGYIVRAATRAMEVRRSRRALDVNSLDEVPDSTWFTNRIGVRDLTLAELRAGPTTEASPIDHRPWTITGAKVGGKAVGFVFADTRGYRYLLKFDMKEAPEMETGAHVIANRIFSAIGYNVPQDYLAKIRREDLVIAPDATKKASRGRKVPLTAEDVDRALATVAVDDDGGIRALVSRFVPGEPLGGYPMEGTRPDDPNDLIPHQRRRSIRGQYAIFAWLNHADIKEDNTLDAYVADPAHPDRHHVLHYLVDFGIAFGGNGRLKHRRTVGHTYLIDVGRALPALLGLGLWRRPWEKVDAPAYRGVGLYEAASYDPGAWRANTRYWPLEDKDRFDAFWGAKLLIRFTRDQLAAIVDEARYSDPRAARYMVDTLVARQKKTARYWFARVAPLDRFAVEREGRGAGLRVCFDDLMLTYSLASVAAGTRYDIEAFDQAGRSTTAARVIAPDRTGRTCVADIVPGTADDGYTIVRFTLRRSARGRALPPVLLHLARDAAGTHRVIGLRRE